VRINRSVTLSFDLFDLEAGAEHCTCRAETSYQFLYFYDYSFSSYGPHGSDRPCNLVTLTFDLRGHGGGW